MNKITLLTLDPREFEPTNRIILEVNGKILEAKVDLIRLVQDNTFEVSFQDKEFMVHVSNFFHQCPGSIIEFFCLTDLYQFDPLALYEEKLRRIH